MWARTRAALLILVVAGVALACRGRDEPAAVAPESAQVAELRARVDDLERRLAPRSADAPAHAADSPAATAAEVPAGVAPTSDPAALLEQARAAIAAREWGLAYRILGTIHALHPDSPQDAEAYPLAASLFVRMYTRSRFSAPDSAWITAEPTFMFAWLATRFGSDFPQQAVDDLLKGVPYALGSEFAAFAGTHPKLREWTITFRDDNGMVEAISAERSARPAAAGSGDG